jgi:hypothetical protein
MARDAFGREIPDQSDATNVTPQPQQDATAVAVSQPSSTPPTKREQATDALGRRVGSLSDEVDFPAFVASLVHGTFDAIVDSSIRQMESFAELVAAVAKPLEQFTAENVTDNQARDYLVGQYPQDVGLSKDGGSPTLIPATKKPAGDEDEDTSSPAWLSEYGLDGEEITSELLEQQVLPHAREAVAKQRLQTLSTMVLLGMNRVVVKDGTINAKVRFRAAAADKTAFDYATGADPQTTSSQWGTRGSTTYDAPTTKISTMGLNVQSDSTLQADLSGQVSINFASETVPLDRFVDDVRRNELERHARGSRTLRPAAPTPVAATTIAAPASPAATPSAPPASAGGPR